jgi:DNA-binding transcriptional regulator Cro
MKYAAALEFYKTPAAIAVVLGISDKAVYKWAKKGVVPANSALRLQVDSKGEVKVDPKDYERANGRENARV